MSLPLLADDLRTGRPFRHEALFYAGDDDFLDGAASFIQGGVRAQEPILVVVSARKIDLLRTRLASDADKVRFADMDDVGLNPARIIPAWTDFVHEHGDRPMRGIGEPISAQRDATELVECQHHESLINVAFAASTGFTLLCPYDTAALGPEILDEARHSHPFVDRDGPASTSPAYLGLDTLAAPLSEDLADPPDSSTSLAFQGGSLEGLRALVRRMAAQAGLGAERTADAVIAVNEVASNSLCHAGGSGLLRMWSTRDTLICEVSDDGHIEDPLVGRVRPAADAPGGRGLWIANQLCELVQIRSSPAGTTVRMHLRRDPGCVRHPG
jgi:anti-sigma regulatory factor (Ser/Thr protein kinase)